MLGVSEQGVSRVKVEYKEEGKRSVVTVRSKGLVFTILGVTRKWNVYVKQSFRG